MATSLPSQDIVSLTINNLFGDRDLSPHRINCDDGSLQVDKFQKLRNRCNFIGLFFRRHLCQRESEFRQPGTDHVHGAESLRTIVAALHCLAINRHVILFFRVDARLFFRRITQRVQPTGKTGLKRIDF